MGFGSPRDAGSAKGLTAGRRAHHESAVSLVIEWVVSGNGRPGDHWPQQP
jgi:hypothetical protein